MKYRNFGRTGLRVAQVALGTGNFGTGWGHGADAATSAAIFNAYTEAGGNFIDTADVYQFGQSEEILGSLLDGRREEFVLATKFTRGAAPIPTPTEEIDMSTRDIILAHPVRTGWAPMTAR